MIRKILIIVSFFWNGVAVAQVSDFSWLIGTWQEKGKSNFETWQLNGSELHAESYGLKPDGSKNIMEKIRLIKRGREFFFVPDVPQNKKPIEFKITSHSVNGFVAENPQHDFPKKISYQIVDKELHATISDGKNSVSYFFVKVK